MNAVLGTPTILPVKKPNAVCYVEKLADGGLFCRQNNGNTFIIDKDDKVAQAFVVFTMANLHASER